MSFGLDLLRELFGMGGQGATPAAAAPPGAASEAGATPGATPPPAPDAQTGGQAGAQALVPASSGAAALPQLPQTANGLPPLPQWGKRGVVGDTLDNIFLGGAIQRARATEFQHDLDSYNLARSQAVLNELPKVTRQAAVLNPAETGKALASNVEFHALAPGNTGVAMGDTGTAYTAPQFDEKSGAFVQATPGGGMIQSPGVGGDYKAADGVVVSGRTGGIANRYALPQKLGPSEHIGSFVPGAPGPSGLPQLPAPQANAAPAAPPMPAPADVLAAAPGAQISSGYRDPQHNLEVGGVPNSWHTAGSPDAPGAIDLTPPQGMTVAALSSTLASKLPQLRVLNEGNHAHVQPNARNLGVQSPGAAPGPRTDASGSIIDEGHAPAQVWSPPAFNPRTNRMEQTNTATGEIRDAGAAAFDPQAAKQNFTGSEAYKDYASANDAFKAMVHAAGLQNGGMRAYALRDTFARTINPGAVARVGTIQAIKEAQGVPAQAKAYFMNLKGDGDVPPEIAQQIIDVSRGFLASHYATAKALNDSNGAQASRYGQNPQDAMAPMETAPGNVHLSLPPKTSLIEGDVYKTARGLATWTGQAFVPYGR